MSKKCWLCKNTDDLFIKRKKELIFQINDEIEQCNYIEKNIKSETADKLGFTNENKKLVQSIPQIYSEMTLSAILENRKSFSQLDSSILILCDYYDKYFRNNKNIRTLKDLIQKYIEEPCEERYKTELKNNSYHRSQLNEKLNQLNKISTFFVEKEINDSYLDKELHNIITFRKFGFNIKEKIYLCPICAAMINEASSASFESHEIQNKEQYEDFDDDEEL